MNTRQLILQIHREKVDMRQKEGFNDHYMYNEINRSALKTILLINIQLHRLLRNILNTAILLLNRIESICIKVLFLHSRVYLFMTCSFT